MVEFIIEYINANDQVIPTPGMLAPSTSMVTTDME
jgi:hypothetical protein